MIGYDQCDGVGRLHVGLVEAREGPSCVGCFELSGRDHLVGSVDVGERRSVEPD